jgi:hypothetical protein
MSKLQWEQTEPAEWRASDGDQGGARITSATNDYLGDKWKGTSTFSVYRDGNYLGKEDNLKAAQRRAEENERDPENLRHVLAFGYPAFLALNASERKAASRRYAGKSTREILMSKYDKMGQAQLTTAYNDLVTECEKQNMGDLAKPMARFTDEEAARKAVMQLEGDIRDRLEKAKPKVNDPAALKPDSHIKAASPQKPPKVVEAKPQKPPKVVDGTSKGKGGAKAPAKDEAKPLPKGGTKAKGESVLSTSPPVKTTATALDGFLVQIEARAGTNKEKLATCLFKNFGKDVKTSEVCKHVYGKATVVPAINAVIAGLASTIKKKSLAYEIKRKDDALGLYAASQAR